MATAGSLALELDRSRQAHALFLSGLHLAQRDKNTFLSMQLLGNLGVLALRSERYEQASGLFEQAATLSSSLNARLALEKYQGNVGYSLYGAGDFIRALSSFRAATEKAEILGASIDEVRWLINTALCEFVLKQNAAAGVDFRRALGKAEAIANQEVLGDAQLNLGLFLMTEQPGEAKQHADIALSLARSRGNKPEEFAAEMLHGSILAEHGDRRQGRRELLGLTLHRDLAPSLRWRVEDELGKVAEAEHEERAADIWFQRALDTFHRQRRSLTTIDFQLPFRENASDVLNDYLEHLIANGREWEALRVLDGSLAETLDDVPRGMLPQGKQISGAELGQHLAEQLGGTVLVYRVRPQHTYLWAIGEHRRGFYRLQGGTTLHGLLEQHQAAVAASRDLIGPAGEAAHALFDALVAPARTVIGDSDRVFLETDETLTGLNFETLLTPGVKPHFWIEDVAITNTRSLWQLEREFRSVPVKNDKVPSLLLMGAANARPYPDLPHASEEMARVASHFARKDRTVLTGEQATPLAYEQGRPGEFTYLHFVAHAEADALDPMQSAIVLGAPAGAENRFRLLARDVLRQPLHAELVTLSACYGSGARSYSGEGLVGLAWAFQRAGARHVIGALWEVSDVTTPALMDRLYEELGHGVPPDRALRAAKLTLLHGSGVVRKPFYWAPFTLY